MEIYVMNQPIEFPHLSLTQTGVDPVAQGFVLLPDTLMNAIDENKPTFFRVLLSGIQPDAGPVSDKHQLQHIQKITKRKTLHYLN